MGDFSFGEVTSNVMKKDDIRGKVFKGIHKQTFGGQLTKKQMDVI
jgi:hypothetical protein